MIKPPCKNLETGQDCPRRAPGCGAKCPEWQKYVAERDAEYTARGSRNNHTGDEIRVRFSYKTEKQRRNLCRERNKRFRDK